MKKCPNCNEKTIPFKWLLFGKANGQKGRCYQCENCSEKIKSIRFFGILEDVLYSEFGLVFLLIVMMGYSSFIDSFLTSITLALVTIVFVHLIINLIVHLKVANEGYCQGEMTKIGAFFGLIIMATLILFMVNFFVIQPFFR